MTKDGKHTPHEMAILKQAAASTLAHAQAGDRYDVVLRKWVKADEPLSTDHFPGTEGTHFPGKAINDTPAPILAAMARRSKLVFDTHDSLRPEPFTCYPKDDAQRDAWLASAVVKGWTLL